MASRAPRSTKRDERASDPNAPQKQEVKASAARGKHAAAARKERVPLGVARSKLTVPPREGYVRRWVNDDGKGRLQFAKEGDYAFVEDPDLRVGEDEGQSRQDSRVSRIVGRTAEGKPMRAYLMEIPRELYQQDQHSKQSELDEVDRAIRKGRLVSAGEEHRYVPDEGRAIKIKRELVKAKAADGDDDRD